MNLTKIKCCFLVLLTILSTTSCASIENPINSEVAYVTVDLTDISVSETSDDVTTEKSEESKDDPNQTDPQESQTEIVFGLDGEPIVVEKLTSSVYPKYKQTETEKQTFDEWSSDMYPGKMEKLLRNGCFNIPDENLKFIDFRRFNSYIRDSYRAVKKKLGYTTSATYPMNIFIWNSIFPVQKIVMHSENLISIVYKLKSFDQTFYAYVMLEKDVVGGEEAWNYWGEIYYVASISSSDELLNQWNPGYQLTDDDFKNYPLLLARRTLGTDNKNEEWMEYIVCKDGIIVLKMRCDYDVTMTFYENLHRCEVFSTAFYKYGESSELEFGYSTFIEHGIKPAFIN